MKFSLSWLNEYIPVTTGIEDLADGLTMAGLEVDSVTPLYDSLDKVVVGKILEAKPHPNADKAPPTFSSKVLAQVFLSHIYAPNYIWSCY